MWVDRATFDSLKIREAQATAAGNEVLRQLTAQQTSMDWLMMRVTQLEKERAQLLLMYTGVKIETPVITRDPTNPVAQNVPIDALPVFDDIGDAQAKKLGIGWNPDGTLSYGK